MGQSAKAVALSANYLTAISAPQMARPANRGNDMFRRSAAHCLVNLRVRHRECGATAVEYALMVMLIALVVIGAVTGIGSSLTTIFSGASSRI